MEITTKAEIMCRRSPCLISSRKEITISKTSRLPSPKLTDGAPTPSPVSSSSSVEDPRLSSRRHCRSSTVAIFAVTREFARSQKPVTTHP
ncbi:hypothetical protein TIFTF001_010977 [Ficus carica]|uniref:Uncharacterized protein n=1 Tax=Ficus carica TaxID=3494 RepID=A0AA87ZXV2_FICCA|nr:hypothetical protein TIFTF001_010977 [Ficus carica]